MNCDVGVVNIRFFFNVIMCSAPCAQPVYADYKRERKARFVAAVEMKMPVYALLIC